jgi:hypothetical protein
MPKPTVNKCKSLDAVCNTLRARIMLRTAAVRLPSRLKGESDTDWIKRALTAYLDTWVLPLLDAIQDGNARNAKWARIRLVMGESAPYGSRMRDDGVSHAPYSYAVGDHVVHTVFGKGEIGAFPERTTP